MKKTTAFLLFPILALVFFFIEKSTLTAQNDNSITIGEAVKFNSEILDEERTILVHLPRNYKYTSNSFPVLYLLDGGTHFYHASGMTDFLAASGKIPEMIVVAITNVDRSRDFSPTHVNNIPTSGGAKDFLAFLKKELLPFVERNYRTSDFGIIAGHSFGGTFVTYTLLEEPELFKGILAISPYLMYDNEMVVDQAETDLRKKYDKLFYYMTVGQEPGYFKTLERFEKIIKTKAPKGFSFNSKIYPEDNHGSVPHISMYDGLRWIFADWQLPAELYAKNLSEIDAYFKKISAKYDCSVIASENLINRLGYQRMGKGNVDEAIAFFQSNVERYPESANVYDSLGEAYENNGQINEAAKNYAIAVQKAEKTDHPNLAIYKTNLDRAQKLVVEK